MTESVWDYPRPPALVRCERRVRVELGGVTVADSTAAWRVLETSHPPTIYVPPEDIATGSIRTAAGSSFCEWKGVATYFDVVACQRREERAAWAYPDPAAPYEALRDHVAFYPGRMDACRLDDELVQSQPGDFYGGWISADLRGPFKGAPGTRTW
ncbi:MAG TPA: DUF427 domain-containing protein [Solirubrobacteraceae bacterium]|nr:DUF427 domain-containing protein [Solirubrobacteraceae bacterium]